MNGRGTEGWEGKDGNDEELDVLKGDAGRGIWFAEGACRIGAFEGPQGDDWR